MPKKDIKKHPQDRLGRPIPEWSETNILIPVKNGSISMDGKNFLANNKYLRGLTDKSQGDKGGIFLVCRLKDGSKILNLNDRNDYISATRLAGNFNIEEIGNDQLFYISLGGLAGLFYPTKAGVWLCDPGAHLEFKGIEKGY